MRLIPLYKKEVQRIINIILWLIGKDIDDDNLLLMYGFDRARPNINERGSSRYSILIESHTIVLWGFGMLIHNNSYGVFVNRHIYNPKVIGRNGISKISNIWSIDKLSMLIEPSSSDHYIIKYQLNLLFKQLYKYELWAMHLKGRSIREYYISKFINNYNYNQLLHALELLARDVNYIPL